MTLGQNNAADLNGMVLFSWGISLPALGAAFVTLLFGKLSDLYGRRTMLLVSLVLCVIGSILSAISPTFESNIAARVVNYIGFGAMVALCFSVIGDLFEPGNKGNGRDCCRYLAATPARPAPFSVR